MPCCLAILQLFSHMTYQSQRASCGWFLFWDKTMMYSLIHSRNGRVVKALNFRMAQVWFLMNTSLPCGQVGRVPGTTVLLSWVTRFDPTRGNMKFSLVKTNNKVRLGWFLECLDSNQSQSFVILWNLKNRITNESSSLCKYFKRKLQIVKSHVVKLVERWVQHYCYLECPGSIPPGMTWYFLKIWKDSSWLSKYFKRKPSKL